MQDEFQQLVNLSEKEENQKEQHRMDVSKIDDLDLLKDFALTDDDWLVRKLAALKIDDESVLAEIAKNDEDHHVRKAAISKIHDNDILRHVVEDDTAWYCRDAALKNCSDEKFLTEVFLVDKDYYIRNCARMQLQMKFPLSSAVVKPADTEGINEESKFDSILFKNVDLTARRDAFKKIDDTEIILYVAFKSHEYQLVNMAIEKIDDEEILRKLYNTTKLEIPKIVIMEKLGDENLAKDIIFSFHGRFAERRCLSLISDEKILAEIVNEDIGYGCDSISNRAKEKLNELYPNSSYLKPFDDVMFDSQKDLYDYVKYALDSESRLKAFSYIDDQALLLDIALNHFDRNLEEAASEKISNKDDLKKIALNARFKESRLNAISRINDEGILVDVLKSSDSNTRSYILQYIKDESKIIWVYENDSNSLVRIDAVDKIKNQQILGEIALNDSDSWVRSNAIKGIEDNSILKDVAFAIDERFLFEEIIYKIKDKSVLFEIKENLDEHDPIYDEKILSLEFRGIK